ncbi:hypothetical protein BC835DRAFT_772692 [Cytidiella melzeri]|nr:hypothetical protein BC835DRAFT_772692 [Cytidiella melzeri]
MGEEAGVPLWTPRRLRLFGHQSGLEFGSFSPHLEMNLHVHRMRIAPVCLTLEPASPWTAVLNIHVRKDNCALFPCDSVIRRGVVRRLTARCRCFHFSGNEPHGRHNMRSEGLNTDDWTLSPKSLCVGKICQRYLCSDTTFQLSPFFSSPGTSSVAFCSNMLATAEFTGR